MGYADFTNQEKYLKLLRFNSSNDKDEKGLTSIEDYVGRLKEGQKEIYYVIGNSRDSIEVDPHLEIFKNKDLEVLYLYDPIDEFVINSIRKYKDFEFKSVDGTDLNKLNDFKDVEEKKEKVEELSKDDEKHFDSLLARIKDILGDKVTEVRESKRLSNSPSLLVNPDDAMSAQMQKLLRMTNQEVGNQKKIFEINKDHALIRNLLTAFKVNSKDEFITNVVEEMFESALLLEGSLIDPHQLVKNINKLLVDSSEWYIKTKGIKE